MIEARLVDLAGDVIRRCAAGHLRLALAESCTGGLISARLTDVPGASAVLDRALITYSNAAKHELLGVPEAILERCGAVSEEVARAMAEGALARAPVDLAAAVTGIAGPGGGTPLKPVGLVHIAAASRGQPTRHRRRAFTGDRAAVRVMSVQAALDLLLTCLDELTP